MPRSLFIFALVLLLALPAAGQLRKNRLLKVDPAAGLFRELRVAMEHRLWDGEWWGYLAPTGFHQNWLPKRNERLGRPENPQKYYGLGLRAGLRKYLSGDSPKGLYLNGMAGYRYTWVNQYNDGLTFVARDRYHSLGVGFTVGWQELYGRKDVFAYGLHIGMEYYSSFGNNYDADNYVQNWYEFPFRWKPDVLYGFRLFIGVELGFAFLQKNLHW